MIRTIALMSLLVGAFVGFSSVTFAICDNCTDGCCCECSYTGPAEGGGTLVCENIERQCESNQTASCSCNASGCTTSCTTHTNQGSLDMDDPVYTLTLNHTTLNGICRWIKNFGDETWDCDPGTVVGSESKTYSATTTIEGTLEAVASDLDSCVEIDEVKRTIEFRSLLTCQ